MPSSLIAPDQPVFVGLDLAWSRRNRTGGAIIQDGRLVAATGLLQDDEEVLDFVAAHLPPSAGAVVAVDAPLCVPNEDGTRRCDYEVSRAWGAYDAGAYPANRRRLAYDGTIRGEKLADALVRGHSFVQTAPIPQQERGRYLCEVFPHPAHIVLFALPRILRYKEKAGRSRDESDAELVRYRQLLATLATYDPPLRGLEMLRAPDDRPQRGRARQELEETLDAVTCAYVALYAWWHGPARQRVFGTVPEGHILTLLPPPGMELPPPSQRRKPMPMAAIEATPMPPEGSQPKPMQGVATQPAATQAAPAGPLPPDTLNARIGVLTRREVEARMLAPLIEALSAEFGRERVIEVVRDAIVKIAQQQGAALAESMGSDGLPAFADSLRFWTQDNALEIEVLQQGEQAFDFNVTRCRYAEMYRALGIPELGAVFSCNRDAALIEGFNADVEFTRTQTIMQGAAFCDFRYRLRSHPDAPVQSPDLSQSNSGYSPA